jgi:hypothetical protein
MSSELKKKLDGILRVGTEPGAAAKGLFPTLKKGRSSNSF